MSTSLFEPLITAAIVIGKNSGLQFLGSFGLLFISGLLLSFISKWINNSFQQFLFPRFGLYIFGVIGVPIHEFCHALFAKLFFHDIQKIKWFDPQGKGGSYGCVTHFYQEKNLYHRIGLFFIGMGPVLLAPALLLAGYYLFVPGSGGFSLQWSRPALLAENFTHSLLAGQNWTSIGFYLFIYFAICLTSQMELSPDDLKIARGGGLPFLLLLFLINTIAYLMSYSLHTKLTVLFHTAAILWSACFFIAVLVSAANLFFCVLMLNMINRLCGKKSINPFRSHS
jgi:hypothetical protein